MTSPEERSAVSLTKKARPDIVGMKVTANSMNAVIRWLDRKGIYATVESLPGDGYNWQLVVNHHSWSRGLSVKPGGWVTLEEGKYIAVVAPSDFDGQYEVVTP